MHWISRSGHAINADSVPLYGRNRQAGRVILHMKRLEARRPTSKVQEEAARVIQTWFKRFVSSCVASGNCSISGNVRPASLRYLAIPSPSMDHFEGLIVILMSHHRQTLLRWANHEFIKVEKATAAREHRKKMSQSDAYRTKFQVFPLPRNIATPCLSQ